MSAARGAISLLEKSWTVSRMASAVSPRSKLNIRCALGIMVGLPPGKSRGLSGAQLYALEISLSRANGAEKRVPPDCPAPGASCTAECIKLRLPWRAQRDVIRLNDPPPESQRKRT